MSDDADPATEAPRAAAAANADAERRQRLRAMQRLALALLLAMAVLFVLAHALRGRHEAWGYVAAFAEAAMIGALADWFAVVALFRHPLGLPIWHTAIVPRRKDDIARNLGQFVESHFVTAEAVLGHVRRFDPAGRAAGWLAAPEHSATLGQGIAGALQRVLQHFDDHPPRDALRQRLTAALANIDPMPFAARWAEALVEEGRHQQALDWALQRSVDWLESETAQPSIAQVLDTVDHVLVSALSGRIASVVRSGALRLCRGALADPDHVLRQRWEGLVARGLERLHSDPQWAERVQGFQQELLQSERLRDSLDGLWADLRQALLDDLQQPSSSRTGQIASNLLAQLSAALAADAAARAWFNELLCRAAEPVVERNRGQVAAYIQRQIDAWSKDEMTERIELAIGRDLQFIRINGTLVGGLVGVLLHAAVRLLPA
jgi:uncharacterized membrane-anchored protein YjiN (DUF445 family)